MGLHPLRRAHGPPRRAEPALRLAVAVIAWVSAFLALSSPAAASCGPTASTPVNAARAEAVIYGTITDVGAGTITVRVVRVLKGQVGSSVRVFVGPSRGEGATSVDYPDIGRSPQIGSDHVLYLVRGGDGQLETNACVGSHAGPPDASEVAFFGPRATSASPSPTGAAAVEPTGEPVIPVASRPGAPPAVVATLVLATIGILATIAVLRRRR